MIKIVSKPEKIWRIGRVGIDGIVLMIIAVFHKWLELLHEIFGWKGLNAKD